MLKKWKNGLSQITAEAPQSDHKLQGSVEAIYISKTEKGPEQLCDALKV